MKPENLTEEELKIWNTPQFNEYHRTRSILALRAVKEMLKNPLSREESIAQVIRLFKQDLVLTPEEEVIWNNTLITEHRRMQKIQNVRAIKERAEYFLQKYQRPEMPKPSGREN